MASMPDAESQAFAPPDFSKDEIRVRFAFSGLRAGKEGEKAPIARHHQAYLPPARSSASASSASLNMSRKR